MPMNHEWADRVVRVLQDPVNRPLFLAAIEAHREDAQLNGGFSDRSPPVALLEELRGDEPDGEAGCGCSPEEYALFLVTEWRLFGPRGE